MKHLYLTVGHGDGKVIFLLPREKFSDPEIQKSILVVVACLIFLISDILDHFGVFREGVP